MPISKILIHLLFLQNYTRDCAEGTFHFPMTRADIIFQNSTLKVSELSGPCSAEFFKS